MADIVRQACEACFEAHKDDCSAFVRAVAEKLGVHLEGVADDLVEILRTGAAWTRLENGPAAALSAKSGMLVLAGLKGAEQAHPSAHGHVVVVVNGPLNRNKYPSAFWGSLGGEPGDDKTINWAWTAADRDRVSYAAVPLAVEIASVPGEAPATAVAGSPFRLAEQDTGGVAIPFLAAAIQAAAPDANSTLWTRVLEPHLVASDMTTPRRVAAFLGQAVAEAGTDFGELAENTLYTHAERLCSVYPSHFPTMDVARRYVGNDQRIACRAYSHVLGNGDEASGDGWRFRGSGLLQITGRTAFTSFARVLGAPVEQVADWTRTPQGAAASACWYWRTNRLNRFADIWDLDAVTRGVNGSAMLGREARAAAAEMALHAAGRK